MTVIGTPIIQSTPDRMTRLLALLCGNETLAGGTKFRFAGHMPRLTSRPDNR